MYCLQRIALTFSLNWNLQHNKTFEKESTSAKRLFFYQIFSWICATCSYVNVFFLFAAFCLKDLKIFVPEAVITGNAATLSCQYELEQVSELADN